MGILQCYSFLLLLASNKNGIEVVQSTPMLLQVLYGLLGLNRVRTQNEKGAIETMV